MSKRIRMWLQDVCPYGAYFCGWCGAPFPNDDFRIAHENACSKNPMNGG